LAQQQQQQLYLATIMPHASLNALFTRGWWGW